MMSLLAKGLDMERSARTLNHQQLGSLALHHLDSESVGVHGAAFDFLVLLHDRAFALLEPWIV